MAKKRKVPDWEAIEREYRAGQLSIAEIARQFSISRAAIQKVARENSWVRDLSKQVREATNAKMMAAEVAPKVAPSNAREIVDAASDRNFMVLSLQRRDIAAARERTAALGAQIQRLLRVVGEKPDDDANLLSFLSTAANANKAALDALSKAVSLERQAFGLDEPAQQTPAERVTEDQRRRMAREVLEDEG